jgi:ATP-binding cassette subfamily B protein
MRWRFCRYSVNDVPSTLWTERFMAEKSQLRTVIPGIGKILGRFSPQIRKQRGLLAASFLALLAETGLHLLEPWPLKFIFDRIILRRPGVEIPYLTWVNTLPPLWMLTALAVGLIGITMLRGAMAYLSIVGMAIAATRIMTDIRSKLYSHIQRLSLAFHSESKTGDLITRVTYDVERLREVTVVAVLPLLTNVLNLVGMLAVMFWLNWELALIAIAILPLFALSATRMGRRIRAVAREQRQREGVMAATAAEAIGAIKVVQALSLQTMLEQAFDRQNQKSLKEGARAQRLSAGLERTVEILVAIATAAVLWRGTQLVLNGVVTPGDLLVFTTYLKIAFKPMRQLAKYTGQIAKATASGERIVEILDTVPDIRDARGAVSAPAFRGKVEFRQVSFTYNSGDQDVTLKNLSFTVEAGQKVALVGPSGGGKSTLVSLLLRLYDPTEGSIRIDGHDLREYTIDSLRRQMSIVLQESVLFAASVRDNIAYGNLDATLAEIEAAARLANAHEFILALPQGYDTILGERGATLSGGQRQRIAIARAAIRRSPIVILDEPTTGLDNQSEHLVQEALERLTQHCTTFWVSHNLNATRHADQILYIAKGRILERGTHAELMNLNGFYASLYQLQNESNHTQPKPYAFTM